VVPCLKKVTHFVTYSDFLNFCPSIQSGGTKIFEKRFKQKSEQNLFSKVGVSIAGGGGRLAQVVLSELSGESFPWPTYISTRDYVKGLPTQISAVACFKNKIFRIFWCWSRGKRKEIIKSTDLNSYCFFHIS